MRKWLVCLGVLLVMAGCATIQKVESGVRPIGERLTIKIEGDWNHLDFPGLKPAQIWTMEGITVDELLIYSGIKDGQAMHAETDGAPKDKKIVFRSNMRTEEIVSMFSSVLSRDGSTFKLVKVQPYPFGGRAGFRFDYERVRKVDGVIEQGMSFGAVDKGELFAVVYQAPRLTFFPRHRGRVEAIGSSAAIL
jgi:hypothetical protein